MAQSSTTSIIHTISLEEVRAHPLLIAINVSLGNIHKLQFDGDKAIYLISETQYHKLCREFVEEKGILA